MATAIPAKRIMINAQQIIFLERFWCCLAAARWVTPVSTWAKEALICAHVRGFECHEGTGWLQECVGECMLIMGLFDRTVGFFVGFFSGLVGSHGERPTTRNAIHDDLITVRYNVDEPNPMGGLDATPNFDADQKRESRNEKQRHEVVRTQSRRRLTRERQQ